MSYDSVRAAIFGYIQTQWAAAHPTVPLQFENQTGIDTNTRQDPFVLCELRFRDAEQATLENVPKLRQHGEVHFIICVRVGKGTKAGLEYAETIKNFMKFKLLSGIQFMAPRLRDGVDEDGWYVWPLSVSFRYDE